MAQTELLQRIQKSSRLSGVERSDGMPLQGHQQQRLIRALDHQGKELQGEWSGLCAIRWNEHDLDRGFTRNPAEGKSEPCDAGKEGQRKTVLE